MNKFLVFRWLGIIIIILCSSCNDVSILAAAATNDNSNIDADDDDDDNIDSNNIDNDNDIDDELELCDVYLALTEYSPVDNDEEEIDNEDMPLLRWGLFAGRSLTVGETLEMPGDVSIPILDWHDLVQAAAHDNENNENIDNEDNNNNNNYGDEYTYMLNYLAAYLWDGRHAGTMFEKTTSSSQHPLAMMLGVGILTGIEARYHAYYNDVVRHNVRLGARSIIQRRDEQQQLDDNNNNNDLVLSASSRGAYSSYFNATLQVTTEIPLGAELILPGFFEHPEDDDNDNDEEQAASVEDLFALQHYPQMQGFVDQLDAFFQQYRRNDNDNDDNDEETNDALQEVYRQFLAEDYLVAALGKKRAEYAKSVFLPTNLVDLDPQIPLWGKPKTKEWIMENGFCLDASETVTMDTSTIPSAGRGAFAGRAFEPEERILLVPLLPVPFLDAFLDSASYNNNNNNNNNNPRPPLLLNYCWGHPESSMYFLPVAPGAALLNHSPTPNARLEWSTELDLAAQHDAWLQAGPFAMVDAFSRQIDEDSSDDDDGNAFYNSVMASLPAVDGLVMEVVALREIESGEEIFIDYGEEWEMAWAAHRIQYQRSNRNAPTTTTTTTSTSAVSLNHFYHQRPYLTKRELVNTPYPATVQLVAFVPTDDLNLDGTRKHPEKWPRGAGADEISTYTPDNLFVVAHVWERQDGDNNNNDDNDEEHKMDYLYTVEFVYDDDDEESSNFVVRGVPHQAFAFVDQPGTSDLYAPKPFRHVIGIPDDIFPQGVWRDLVQES